MSLKKVSKDQPDKFEFSDENLNLAKKIVLNYPTGKKKSAVMAPVSYTHLTLPTNA